MNKLIRDGKVAVLYSPGFGAGWYSWHNEQKLVFDKDIVEAVLGGARDLQVAWIDEGDQFEINEYDGSESIHIIGRGNYLVA